MKFLRFKSENKIKYGYLDENKVIELPNNFLNFHKKDKNYIKNKAVKSYNKNNIKIISPVKPEKIVCVGLNYKNHAKELNMLLPTIPKIFLKPSSAVIAHCENIIYPEMSNEVDYEGELAIVIGKLCKNIPIELANDYIFGYTIINDVTARDIQRYDEQWTRAKSFDTFAPIGPVIENEMNPLNQKISLKVNNEIKQNSNTKNMIFNPFELVSFISKVMTLQPGDIIATGTPPGVGSMNKGDCVKISIEDIGTLKNNLI